MSDVIANATAPEQTGVVNPADAIAAMIAANKRNNPQPDGSSPPPAGQEEAKAESPEAAPAVEAEPEDGIAVESDEVNSETEAEPSEGVSDAVNFLEFAKENPDLTLRIPNKDAEGGFIELTAEKAASILGQGSAIHENARKLKADRAEFEEFEAKRRSELDGLQIGLELTIVPQLQTTADELVTLQQYNQQWSKILQSATDPAEKAQAEAAIRQNAELIEEKAQFIKANRPKVDQFYQHRAALVQETLDKARQSFSDKELANKAVFSEIREKLAKDWKAANTSFVPGVPNLDLVSSDEYLLSLIRDGLKFREGPKVRNAGGSIAAASKVVAKAKTAPESDVEKLQKQAKSGDKNATRDLLATMLASNKNRKR